MKELQEATYEFLNLSVKPDIRVQIRYFVGIADDEVSVIDIDVFPY